MLVAMESVIEQKGMSSGMSTSDSEMGILEDLHAELKREAAVMQDCQEACRNCRFFNGTFKGECRRYPPAIVDWDMVSPVSAFNVVTGEMWCGEWKAREL
jgi:hypothetical protein